MAYKALSELVVVFSKQLKLKIRTKVGFANSASDPFSILLNFHVSYCFVMFTCHFNVSILQQHCPLSGLLSLPSFGWKSQKTSILSKHSVQIECTEDLYSSVFWRRNRVRPKLCWVSSTLSLRHSQGAIHHSNCRSCLCILRAAFSYS